MNDPAAVAARAVAVRDHGEHREHEQRQHERAEKAKEREFYRYYHHPQSYQSQQAHQAQQSSQQSQSQSQRPAQPLPTSPTCPGFGPQRGAIEVRSPAASDDKALTAFAQLGALRLNARRCLISFFDRRNCYILAEATASVSIRTGQAHVPDDRLCWGTCVFPKHQSICFYTVNLPVTQRPHLDDYDSVPSLVVNDLSADDRFRDYDSVTGPAASRFYAGVPITSPNGHSIGTYCVLDDKPRDGISAVDMGFLKDMSMTVMRYLEHTRAADDHRRRGIMVRSLGSFAEGKANLEDWWQDLWDNDASTSTSGVQLEDTHGANRRGRTTSSGSPAVPDLQPQEPFIVHASDSRGAASPSLLSPNQTTTDTGRPASAALTPASAAAAGAAEPRRSIAPTLSTASSSSEHPNPARQSPEVKALFDRAAKMIREATEADGAIFFDAKISTFGGLVDDECLQDQPDSSEQDKVCAVLGASTKIAATPSSPDPLNPLYEAGLRHLLRAYPHGQIFNFDDNTLWVPSEMEIRTLSNLPTALTGTLAIISSAGKRPESAKSQDDENLLREVFPKARSLVLYPLWDSHRDRWFASAIIWSSDPMRVFSIEQELNYLAAFSNSIMAEVARVDTKLADAAKGDFISSISHELRSPLHGILGCCELLEDTEMNNFQMTMAQTIETCGNTLLDTINHVLDFAKINSLTQGTHKTQKRRRSQTTKHVLSPAQSHNDGILTLIKDVDLCVLTEEVLETVFAGYNFQKSATSHIFDTPAAHTEFPPVSVIVDIQKSDNYVFRTQPGAWRRMLMNLFGNALKYTPAGYTKVKLQIVPSEGPDDDTVELRLIVIDSGIGMSEDYVNNRLFHSFAQENPLSQGTGLGLSIVKQIVESLGGDIEVRSQKDHGTKFTVSCPLKISMLSPPDSLTPSERELLAVRKRTAGINVAFVGFGDEGDYFPVKSLKSKNGTMLTLKALESLCKEWFGMNVLHESLNSDKSADLIISTESGAKMLRAQYTSHPDTSSQSPVVVLCQGAAQAQSTTAITVPGHVFECISQPCGPHKLAKALNACMDRHALQQSTSTETTSSLPSIENLNLKENTSPLRPLTSAGGQSLNYGSPLSASSFKDLRPPFATATSAPEISHRGPVPTKKARAQPLRPLTCLAADDNPINLKLLSTFIGKLHHKHALATNGLEAVAAFKAATNSSPEARFDVVLMDINMPEMDGLEATRQIRAHERDAGLEPVTIIALTGVASSEAQQEAHVSGVNLFLIKPVRLQELETVLNSVVVGDHVNNDTIRSTPTPT